MCQGDRVSTTMGSGRIATVILSGHDRRTPTGVVVVLDSQPGHPGYRFDARYVTPLHGDAAIVLSSSRSAGPRYDRASRHGEYGSRTRRGHGDVTLHTAVIDGKRIGYSSETEFLVQIGKGRGAYKTKYRIVGNLGQAAMYYQGLNIGHGYKKRLLMPSSSKNPVLARASS